MISRLTRHQFINTAAALLGEAATTGVLELVPEPVPNGGFANSGFAQSQAYDVVLAYDTASRKLVDNVSDWGALHAQYGGCTQYECVSDFITTFGEAAFRRPVTDAEVSALMPIVDAATADGLSYERATGLLVRAMLQAPEFLYFFEDEVLTDYQLAARLSYFISDGPPDADLYAAAQSGQLRGSLDVHVERLLDQFGERFGRAFAYDFLGLRKVYQRVVSVEDSVLDALVESARDSFASYVTSGAPVQALFTAESYVINDVTANFLGVTPAEQLQSSADYQFMGLLTHPAVLIANSNAVEGSMVSRGQFIAHQLLCVPPTPPPAMAFNAEDVEGELPPDATQRDEAEARLADPNCAACHLQFEPYAFALNRWGGDGVFKDDPRLDDSGPVSTTLGEFQFDDYRSFLPLLAESEQYRRCITDQMVRYGLRHTEYDASLIDGVLVTAAESELTFRSLARAVVLQEVFATR